MLQNNLAKKTIIFIQTGKRLFLALVFLGMVFLVNNVLYVGHKKTVESCAGGKCLSASLKKPQLTKEKNTYYVDDLFRNQPAAYYRLTFQEKSSDGEKIAVKLNSEIGKESLVGELTLSPSDGFQNQEMVFFLPEGFAGLVFQKDNPGAKGDVFLQSVEITKLNISSPEELPLLKKTLFGQTDIRVATDGQLTSKDVFSELKEPKTLLGQVFRAKEALISAVSLKININKNINPGSRQYVLALREVGYDGKNISSMGPIIASNAFSLSSIERYRAQDGSFLFPLFGALELGKYYLISLDNSKVEVSEQNYMEVLGSNDSESFSDGSAVVKKNKELSLSKGDLYFKIFSANLLTENGAKILGGAKIEDLGKGIGRYSYETKGMESDLFDLASASPGTGFSENDKVIYALAKDSASFSYALNMPYPISKLNFSATQLRAGWKNVKVSYSFDQNSWIDLPFSEKAEIAIGSGANSGADPSAAGDTKPDNNSADSNVADNSSFVPNGDMVDSNSVAGSQDMAIAQETVQAFNSNIVPSKEARMVYFKIIYDPNDASKGRFFALKNLKITADLRMNQPLASDRLK